MRARRLLAALVTALSLAAGTATIGMLPASAAGPRLDLKLLVVAESAGEPAAQAWVAHLRALHVPYDLVELAAGEPLPRLSNGDRAFYQGVVRSNAYQPHLTDELRGQLESFEQSFGIREVVAYAYPSPEVGLDTPTRSGDLNGTTLELTQAGTALFGQLRGSVPVVDDAWGYLAPPADPSFRTLVAGPDGAAVVGSYRRADGVDRLVVTVDTNPWMLHARLLVPGLLRWVTRGIHLGYHRQFLSVHIDDVFLPDDRWSVDGNCTPGEDCPRDANGNSLYATEPIRMTATDVARAVDWQRRAGIRLDLAFNGAGSDEAVAANGSDPLTDALVANRGAFRWVNHTYSHPFLGCVQDTSTVPWRCQTDAAGNTVWTSEATITGEISRNLDFARRLGLAVTPSELVTGEHSGLATLPQQPVDNPNLAPALKKTGVKLVASDASREPAVRSVGSARTVPRHPNNIFYNVATVAEEVDEYNWLYATPEAGGNCVDTAVTTCSRTRLELADILARETDIMLSHVLGNDPRPTYMHQANLAEDGLAYLLLDRVIARFGSLFRVPLVNPTMTQTSELLERAAAFDRACEVGAVTAYLQDGVVTVSTSSDLHVAVTVPDGTTVAGKKQRFGSLYGGERSDWVRVKAGDALRLAVPA